MKKRMAVVVCLMLSAVLAVSASDRDAETVAMEKLAFLVGEWSGQGWIRMGPEGQQTFDSTEIVESKIDGKALVVEGIHTGPGGEAVHHALGVFSWDPMAEKYRFQTYVAGRGAGTHSAWFEGDDLIWEMMAGERRIRYVIEIDDEGRWHETGSIAMDDGPYEFFEMTLEKQ